MQCNWNLFYVFTLCMNPCVFACLLARSWAKHAVTRINMPTAPLTCPQPINHPPPWDPPPHQLMQHCDISHYNMALIPSSIDANFSALNIQPTPPWQLVGFSVCLGHVYCNIETFTANCFPLRLKLPSHVTSAFAFYRLQTKFAKVMFSQVSVCPRGRGDMHG